MTVLSCGYPFGQITLLQQKDPADLPRILDYDLVTFGNWHRPYTVPTACTVRPRSLCARRSLADCSLQELRVLARQHCFAGYTLVDFIDGAPVCTRHHCIDWNYHPCFPRSRPNRWRVLVSPDGSSFKEYGIANDEFGQAVYMERWARLPGDSGGKHFFAMRALPLTPYDEGISGHPCHCNRHPSRVACGGSCGGAQNKGGSDPQPPQQATCGCDASTRVESPSAGDAILVVIGQHFVFVEDRRRLRAGSALDAFQGPGGCANLVDAAHAAGDRAAMEDLLQLEGCYGRIPVPPSAATPAATGARMMSNGDQVIEASGGAGRDAAAPVATGVGDGWKILASTHPWREGQLLLRPGDVQELVADPGNPGDGPTSVLVWRGRQWRVLECSMPWAELRAMFWVLRSAL
eukprot:jgi/Mesvir1/18118/Mv09415-RA.1